MTWVHGNSGGSSLREEKVMSGKRSRGQSRCKSTLPGLLIMLTNTYQKTNWPQLLSQDGERGEESRPAALVTPGQREGPSASKCSLG